MFVDEYRKKLCDNFIKYKGREKDSFLCRFYREEHEEDYRLKLRIWKLELQETGEIYDLHPYYINMLEYVRESVNVRTDKDNVKLFELLGLDCSKGIEKAVNGKLKTADIVDRACIYKAIELAIAIENNHTVTVKKDNPYVLLKETYMDCKFGEKTVNDVLAVIREKFTSAATDEKSGKVTFKVLPKYKVSDETGIKLGDASNGKLSDKDLEAMVEELLDSYLVVKAKDALYNMGCSPNKDPKKGRKADLSLKMVSAFFDECNIRFDSNSFTPKESYSIDVKSKEFRSKCVDMNLKLQAEKNQDVVLPLHMDLSGVGIYIIGRSKIPYAEIDKEDMKAINDSVCCFACIRQLPGLICQSKIEGLSNNIDKIIHCYENSIATNMHQYKRNNGYFKELASSGFKDYFKEKYQNNVKILNLKNRRMGNKE